MISKRILVVDDADDWRDLFQSSLSRYRYEVDTAASLGEAMEKLMLDPPELVIVDLRLDLAEEDNRDGMQLLAELNRRRINAIVVTGYGSVSLREQADSLETITFVEKSDIGRRKEILNEIVGKIFSEMEMRDRRRGKLSDDFARGKAIGFPAEASGYPLREYLNEKIEAVFEKFT